jgi:hypothetical protein
MVLWLRRYPGLEVSPRDWTGRNWRRDPFVILTIVGFLLALVSDGHLRPEGGVTVPFLAVSVLVVLAIGIPGALHNRDVRRS